MTELTYDKAFAHPITQFRLGQSAVGYAQHDKHTLHVIGSERVAVKRQKEFERDKCGALVAVNDGMIFCNSESVRSSQGCSVRIPIGHQVSRSRQRGFERTCISDVLRATMFA